MSSVFNINNRISFNSKIQIFDFPISESEPSDVLFPILIRINEHSMKNSEENKAFENLISAFYQSFDSIFNEYGNLIRWDIIERKW